MMADAATRRKHLSKDIKQKSTGSTQSTVSKDSESQPSKKSTNKENHPPPVIVSFNSVYKDLIASYL